jgi:hypothetical protein
MNSITSAYAQLFDDAQPVEVSLVELVLILSELSEDEDEIFATIDHMIEEGSVRLSPSLQVGSRLPEAY